MESMYGRTGGVKSSRGGKALLSGIMTCGRCRRRLSGCLHRQSAEPTGISRRQAKPYDGPTALHDLRRPAGRCAIGPELLVAVEPMAIDAAFEGGADAPGTAGRSAAYPGPGNAAGPLRGKLGRASLRGLRSGQSPHCRAAGEGLSEIWRLASPLKGDQISRLTRTPSPTWRTICRRPGMRPVSRCALAGNCFGR
jgi:hypothetical protein